MRSYDRRRLWWFGCLALPVLGLVASCAGGTPGPPDIAVPVVLDLEAIAAGSASSARWPETLTGVWGDASAQTGDEIYGGYLVLYEEDGRVTDVSTTGNSLWSGTFRDGVLTADYVVDEGWGTLRLELLDGGGTLSGTWQSGETTGTYQAYRIERVDRAFLVEHLEERLGDKIEIGKQ
jgi:hypothetical protein